MSDLISSKGVIFSWDVFDHGRGADATVVKYLAKFCFAKFVVARDTSRIVLHHCDDGAASPTIPSRLVLYGEYRIIANHRNDLY